VDDHTNPAPEREQPERRLSGPARVVCGDCQFVWYGLTAAHGLSIIGRCPRCGGGLHFRDEFPTAPRSDVGTAPEPVEPPADAKPRAVRPSRPDSDEDVPSLEPSRVLGTPQSWRR
jgi:hypothetical protein